MTVGELIKWLEQINEKCMVRVYSEIEGKLVDLDPLRDLDTTFTELIIDTEYRRNEQTPEETIRIEANYLWREENNKPRARHDR